MKDGPLCADAQLSTGRGFSIAKMVNDWQEIQEETSKSQTMNINHHHKLLKLNK